MGLIPAGMNFWDPWPIWEKLTLVLGCAVFFVFIVGLGVKVHNTRKLRKLEARAAADLAERGEITETMSEEVPFGIRAIEAGDQVDGIWNSKAATPLQAPSLKSLSEPPTPTMKAQKLQKPKRYGSEASFSKLELPEPAHVKQARPREAPVPVPSTEERGIRMPFHEPSGVGGPSVAQTPCPAPGKRRVVIGGRPLSMPEAEKSTGATPNTIERMQAHRRQLTAETGQLERRVRRRASTTVPPPASDSGSSLTISWPSSKSESCATPLSAKREVITPLSYVTDDSAAIKAPPTAWTRKTNEMVEEKLAQSKFAIRMTPGNLSHINNDHRKVNDGFEILPAGSLTTPALVKEFGHRSENSIKILPEETKPTKKLQKRHRIYSGAQSQHSSSDGGLSDKEN